MKVAFDVHGVLDTHEEYRQLMRDLFGWGHTIYVISGQPLDSEMIALLREHDLDAFYDHYFSVESHLVDEGVPHSKETKDGLFWKDKHWDPVKAVICDKEGIDMIFDNSPSYAAEFAKVDTHFNLVIDKTKSLSDKRK